MGKFVHLHTHTEYSLLDGISKISKLVKKTKDLGMDSLAITDHGVMYGAIEFYKACVDAGIKPIIGAEMYMAPRSHKDKEIKLDVDPFHMTVLAKNYQGYLNLMKLVSISHLDGYYYRPRIDKALLKEYGEGLIVLSGCVGGELIKSLDISLSQAEKTAQEYLQIMGEGNYYLEIQNHHYSELLKNNNLDPAIRTELENMERIQNMTWRAVRELSPKLGIPIVATKDLHYIEKSDAQAQDAVLCVQTGKLISDIRRLRMIDTPDLYLSSPEEMTLDFKEMPGAVAESVKISSKINLKIELGKAIFPIFKTPEDKLPMDYLRELTFEKAKDKLEITDEVKERLNYELDIIENKKLADYFLVVADFIDWSHSQGIITNTRGSAAGSLVLYCLGVTNLNPLDYLLPFERFLTKDRPFMPDIDADLADDRRDEVIRYLMSKYGEDRVAHIVTFGTMMGRAAIRDIGRVMNVPYGEVDRIAKLVPPPKQGFHKSLSDALKEVVELNDLYKNDSTVKQMIDLAKSVEGTVRHASVHAAGILIAPDDITNYTPVQREANGEKIVSQYDMFSVVDEYGGLGLVKMDLLGIRNLSILGRAVEYVKINQGVEVNIEKLPLNDKKTYELLARGETMGVFQLSSDGMTRYLMELKPSSIFDIMAMVALYRPGPLSIIPEYISRKHDPTLVSYLDPRMKDYMDKSLGLLVYQEDVLLTAINIAGYSWTEADKFRKAMGKKKPEEMKKEQGHFVEGCVKNGMSRTKAEELFKLIETFAAYGFNKPHAASYAMVAYQTAYMKANFPVEFMAAVMTAEYGDADKIAHAILECKRMNVVVLPPDINESGVGFSIEDLEEGDFERNISSIKKSPYSQGIRFGLSAIKNVGIGAIESIIVAREKGQFESLADVCSRVDTRLVNRKTLESLIKAGALDKFGSRSAQLIGLDQCLNEAHKNSKLAGGNQVLLFDDLDAQIGKGFSLPEVEEMPLEQLLIFEKDLLGFYLHEPPYLKKLANLDSFISLKIANISEEHIDQKHNLGGVILECKKVLTKKNASEMAFVKIFDGTGEIDAVVFPTTYAQNKELLQKEQVILVYGKIDYRDDNFSLVVDHIEAFDENLSTPRVVLTSVEVEIPDKANGELLRQINMTLRKFPGHSPISILIPDGDRFKKMNLQFGVDPNFEMVSSVENILGSGSVRLI